MKGLQQLKDKQMKITSVKKVSLYNEKHMTVEEIVKHRSNRYRVTYSVVITTDESGIISTVINLKDAPLCLRSKYKALLEDMKRRVTAAERKSDVCSKM